MNEMTVNKGEINYKRNNINSTANPKGRKLLTHKGIIAGKLKGQIPAQTPIGSLTLYVSTPCDTFETYSPICRVPIPQACSTTST
jgi:hypothetical protein